MDFHKIAVLNGHFLPLREVRVDPVGTGVHSGWGVYTTVRIYGGHPFNVAAHLRRLERDAGRVGIALPEAFGNLANDLADLARRNGVQDGTGRISVLGAPMGRFSAGGPPGSDLLVLTRDLQPRPPGESLCVSAHRFHSLGPLANTKTISNLPHIQCRREALLRQFDDALLLNESDHVVEVATGNLFWVRDGKLYTPSPRTGCIEGSTRELLIEEARHQGIEVLEGCFPLADLHPAREAFVSSVSREISPVVRLEDHFFPEVPGPISAALQEGFHRRLEAWRTTLPRAEAERAEAAAAQDEPQEGP
ncbi:MAG: aminotransferase class IV [Planctomycetes bacterium]|nr:aminotransferase class IV [Planctomycetota bacterium]